MNDATIPFQTFTCPHCGAPGQVSYGSAQYSCTCRLRPSQAPTPPPHPMLVPTLPVRCMHCGQTFTGSFHSCVGRA
jgi:ribosomal protein S27E